jgi:hypothetical protein
MNKTMAFGQLVEIIYSFVSDRKAPHVVRALVETGVARFCNPKSAVQDVRAFERKPAKH